MDETAPVEQIFGDAVEAAVHGYGEPDAAELDRRRTAGFHVVVTAGGDPWTGSLPRLGSQVDAVYAADSGADLALHLGFPIDVLIGDLDSVSAAALADAEENGARIVRYPADKDETDLELALDLATADGATTITIVGGNGGRISHLLSIVGLIGAEKYAPVELHWLTPGASTHVGRPGRTVKISGQPGDMVSIIALGDSATVTTAGLRWPLHEAPLASSETRGVSNEQVGPSSSVEVHDGVALVVKEENGS